MELTYNALYQADCLTLLERMPSEQVTLAYIDPPWHPDYIKKDALKEYRLFLSRVVDQIRRLLNQIGSLYFHCPSVSELDFRLILNQVFGKQPSLEIIWRRRVPRNFAVKTRIEPEVILVYSKSDDFVYNPQYRPLSEDEIRTKYQYEDKRGRYRLVDLVTAISRPTQQFKWKGYFPSSNLSWKFSKSKLEQLDLEGKIHIFPSTGRPSLKQYLDENPGEEISTEWDDISAILSSREKTGFCSQKPVALSQYLQILKKSKTSNVKLTSSPRA